MYFRDLFIGNMLNSGKSEKNKVNWCILQKQLNALIRN